MLIIFAYRFCAAAFSLRRLPLIDAVATAAIAFSADAVCFDYVTPAYDYCLLRDAALFFRRHADAAITLPRFRCLPCRRHA